MIRDPDGLRVVWLFGRPYWWDRDDGRLVLRAAAWINPTEEQPVTSVAPCSSKGRPGTVKAIKGGQYECARCGRRWPMSQGSNHPT